MSHSHSEMKREFEHDIELTYGEYRKVHDNAYSDIINMVLDDIVIKPEHYDIGIDTFTRMRANATYEEAMGFIRWNIDKYNTRKKNQDEEDYEKIEAYCKEAKWWFANKR